MSIDLHIHSNFSDGTMTPTELVALAHHKGLRAIALTDHDTLEGLDEAITAGAICGLQVLSGLELSVRYMDQNLHLLGYGFASTDQGLLAALKQLQQGREERNRRILEKLADMGIALAPNELAEIAGQGQCGRPHIAMLLQHKGVTASIEEAFTTYLSRHGKAYCSRFSYQLADAITIITKAGGLAVLAHPLHTFTESKDLAKVLPLFKAWGLDGLEVFYPTHSRRQRRELITLAGRFDLLQTGGSDFHGAIRPRTTLAGGKNLTVPLQLLEEMNHRLMHRRQPI